MKITLEVLKEKGVPNIGIEYFQKFSLKTGKTEFTPLEFIIEACETDTYPWCEHEVNDKYNTWCEHLVCYNYGVIYKCIDSVKELNDIVDYHWKERIQYRVILNDTFKNCIKLYKQDLHLFKRVMVYYLTNNFTFIEVFKYCSEVLEMLPELHKTLKNYVESENALKKELGLIV